MTTTQTPERQEIEELLPWHAAGTLSRREAARVEDALASDPELARRYELVREELAETTHLNETLGAPSVRVMTRLMAAIDAEPARAPASAVSLSDRLAQFIASFSPRTLAWTGVAAALVIAVQAGLLAGIGLTERPGTFQTASGPAAETTGGTYAMVRFKPQATAAEIGRFLADNKLSLAGGPLAGGLFRIRLADSALSKDALTQTLKRLQDDRVVDLIAAAQ